MNLSDKKYQYGIIITGSIGSGKSSVCDILKTKNYKIIDADKISHQILDNLANEIKESFGSEFVIYDKVDRKKLGSLVFSDKKALKDLEKILHPKIEKEIYNQADILEKDKKIYFLDIPLFFESGRYKEFNKVVLVYSPNETLVSRVMKRNSLTKDEVLSRLCLQISIEDKKGLSDFIIDNSGDIKKLETEVERFLRDLKEKHANI